MVNFGKAPIQLVTFRLGFNIARDMVSDPSKLLQQYSSVQWSMTYINNENPTRQEYTDNKTLTAASVRNTLKGMSNFYFFGEYYYTNDLNGKSRRYIFNAILAPPPG